MYIAKLKDGPKKVKKTFSMILEGVFEMVWMRGEMESHQKEDFKVELFFLLLEYWLPLYLKKLLELFFFFLFFFLFLFFQYIFSLFFYAPSLGGFDDILGEK
jgi:hypothetical protein